MTVTREPTVIGAGFLSERGMVPILAGHRRRASQWWSLPSSTVACLPVHR